MQTSLNATERQKYYQNIQNLDKDTTPCRQLLYMLSKQFTPILCFLPHNTHVYKYLNNAAARAAMRRASLERGVRVSEGTINAWLELKFGRLQPDPDLRRCLGLLRAEIQQQEGAK